ncbi:Rha family transcriptional regulator [Oryzibacter oryziterrae]|uniref:Rha family transcriptional regulator n=1 Tax=Oryzibacter oryziterrae TaxID=2766474 RepID=UPI001F4913BD|nr:Rha family transcriptional regulator [Oryzibacter oryziterrae]
MSSLEIAELTGKRHDNVMRDIRSMLVELYGEGRLPSFGGTSKVTQPNGGEREVPCFNLPKRETMILVSGYSVVLRSRIVDRWMELEEAAKSAFAPALPDFTNPARAAIAWAEQYERAEKERRRGDIPPTP